MAKVNPAAIKAGGGFLVKMTGRLFRSAGRGGAGRRGALDVLKHPGGDGVLRHFRWARRRTHAGESFFSGWRDRAVKGLSRKVPADPPRFTIDMHGNPQNVFIGGKAYSADDLARYLRDGGSAWKGEDLRLLSCETGQGPNPFAQQLADRLGVTVRAPNELGWSDAAGRVWTAADDTVDAFGNVIPGSPGRWIDFTPRP